jgi:hypothetical protein
MSLENAWAKLQMQMERDRIRAHYDTQQKMLEIHKSMWDKTKKKMRLTIENPENIDKSPLPNLDGWSIEVGYKYYVDMYEFDIFQHHTIKMSLRIMREEAFDSHYDCTMIGSGRTTVKYSLNKRDLKKKDSFLMKVTEIVERMLDKQQKQYNTTTMPPLQQWGNSPSFGPTHSLNLPF